MRFALTAALLVVLAAPFQVLAAEYYVAQKAAAADDKNPGTLEKPFKTINAGLPKLKAGDTLHIGAGVYRESLMLNGQDWDGSERTPV